MTYAVNPKLTPGDIARILFRHAKKFILVFCVAVAVTFCWILFGPQQYESQAKVYVQVGHETTTLDPSATTGQTTNIEQTLDAQINSMLAIVGSRETIERVVAVIGADTILANDLPGDDEGEASKLPESVAKKLKRQLRSIKEYVLPVRFDETTESLAARTLKKRSQIRSPKNSSIIEISYQAGHPLLAQQIVQAWTDAFIKEHLRITRIEGSHYFFVRQTEEIQKFLQDTEERLKDLKSESGLVSIDGQRKILEDQSNMTRSRVMTCDSLLSAGQAKLKELMSILDSISPRVDSDQTTSQSHQGWNVLREKLFELQIREYELKSKYSATNPLVIAVIQQREDVEKILASQSKSTSELVNSPNPTYEMFQQAVLNEQATVASLIAEKNSLAKQQQEIQAEFQKLNEDAIRISDLERQKLSFETSFQESSARMEQARILEAMEASGISSISKLQQANIDTQPSGLGRFKTLLLGMFLGVVLACGVAAVAEYLDRSFVVEAQVEQVLNLPVLVSVPFSRHQLVEVGR